MKVRDKNTCNEVLSFSALVDATELHSNIELKSVNSQRVISREEKKREASKPLYLTRYE